MGQVSWPGRAVPALRLRSPVSCRWQQQGWENRACLRSVFPPARSACCDTASPYTADNGYYRRTTDTPRNRSKQPRHVDNPRQASRVVFLLGAGRHVTRAVEAFRGPSPIRADDRSCRCCPVTVAVAVCGRTPSRRQAHGCRRDVDVELETQPLSQSGQGGKRRRLVPARAWPRGAGTHRACCPARSATSRAPPGSAAPGALPSGYRRAVPPARSRRTIGVSPRGLT